MVESTPSRQNQPPYKTTQGTSNEAADAAALTYLLTCVLHSPLLRSIFVLLRVLYVRL